MRRVSVGISSMKRVAFAGVLVALAGFSQTPPATGPYLRRAAISGAGGTIHITANSPRPLAQTLDALLRKYGWIVNYEDPKYLWPSDLVEAPGDAPRSRLPGGGSFSVEIPAGAADEEKTLHVVVDLYNQSKNPGRFELRKSLPGSFYVVGTASHDRTGRILQQPVLLDLPLTLATRERTITDTLNVICQSITAHTRTSVTVGVSPRNLLDHTLVKVGGTKVGARELLLQSLKATHHTLYWRLLFDPNSKGYILNIHSA